MGEWKEYKLGDVADITSSKRIFFDDYVDSGIPFYRSKEIIEKAQKANVSTELFITNERFDEIKNKFGAPSDGDILISAVGERAGIPYCVNNDGDFYFKDGNLIWFRNFKNHISSEFLVYYFNSFVGQQALESTMIGSAQKALTIIGLKGLEVSFPSLPEQKTIASILSSLDDKIDLLHRQNKTLELLAETLFRQWFVEEADESWEVQPLGNLVTVKRGGSPRPIQDYLSTSGLRWLKISDVTSIESPFIFEIKEHIKEDGLSKTVFLNKGSIVLSNSATPGIPKLLQVDTCIHDGWLYFPKSYFSNEFLYLLFNMIRPQLLMQGNGSIFTNLKTDIIKEYKIAIPPEDHLLVLQTKIKYLFDKQLFNTIQIRTLTQLRDTLLPKLMSGEIRLNCDLCD
jgi:type I restriction enzyme S subunit